MDPVEQLSEWIRFQYRWPSPGVHCSMIRKSVALPGGERLDLLSVRHQRAGSAGVPEQFVAEIWDLLPRPAGLDDVARVFRKLGIFRAWYSQILEEAELRGLKRRHRFSVHANLVAPGAESGPLLDFLAQQAGELAFWTYRSGTGGIDLSPYYPERESEAPNMLAETLNHLSWAEDPREADSDVWREIV